MAKLLMPVNIIAANLEVPELELRIALHDETSECYRAYMKGYGQQLAELHDAILRSAGNGSNPAQMEALKFINQCRQDISL